MLCTCFLKAITLSSQRKNRVTFNPQQINEGVANETTHANAEGGFPEIQKFSPTPANSQQHSELAAPRAPFLGFSRFRHAISARAGHELIMMKSQCPDSARAHVLDKAIRALGRAPSDLVAHENSGAPSREAIQPLTARLQFGLLDIDSPPILDR